MQYVDGSVIAELGNPDMRTPIAQALAWPERIGSGVESLDLVAAARLDFEAPDLARFPALVLARAAAEAGGTAPAALNAANEVAVARFLDGALAFPFFTIENVDRVDEAHIIVGNDNNPPFPSSRDPNKADDNEFVLLEVAEFLKAK